MSRPKLICLYVDDISTAACHQVGLSWHEQLPVWLPRHMQSSSSNVKNKTTLAPVRRGTSLACVKRCSPTPVDVSFLSIIPQVRFFFLQHKGVSSTPAHAEWLPMHEICCRSSLSTLWNLAEIIYYYLTRTTHVSAVFAVVRWLSGWLSVCLSACATHACNSTMRTLFCYTVTFSTTRLQ